MALTPDQASQLTPLDYEAVAALEREIDTKLLTAFNVVLRRLDYALKAKHTLKVLFELQRRYEIAGWRVTLVRDGEDCSGLTLMASDAPALPTAMYPPRAHDRLLQEGSPKD